MWSPPPPPRPPPPHLLASGGGGTAARETPKINNEEQHLIMEVLQAQHREDSINMLDASSSSRNETQGPADARPKRKARIRAGRVVQVARLKGRLAGARRPAPRFQLGVNSAVRAPLAPREPPKRQVVINITVTIVSSVFIVENDRERARGLILTVVITIMMFVIAIAEL